MTFCSECTTALIFLKKCTSNLPLPDRGAELALRFISLNDISNVQVKELQNRALTFLCGIGL
jgi:hypothetical protein